MHGDHGMSASISKSLFHAYEMTTTLTMDRKDRPSFGLSFSAFFFFKGLLSLEHTLRIVHAKPDIVSIPDVSYRVP